MAYTGNMTYEGNGDMGESVLPPRRRIPHYHGDSVRILFVIGAVIMIVAQSTGAELQLSTRGIVILATILVVAAGITSPRQFWIHWVNAIFAALGTFFFGTNAVDHYRAGTNIFNSSFIYVEILAILSLIALYFTTRNIRGIYTRIKTVSSSAGS